MAALLTTSVPGLANKRTGKVREVYDLGDDLLIIATDRISAFDAVMKNGIPDKGKVLNKLSAYWFHLLDDVCPHHLLSTDDDEIQSRLPKKHPELLGRSTLAKKAQPLAIECVARGYITGSLYKEYKTLGSQIRDISLPEGLVDASKLPEPIFTPATKAVEGHDENISFAQAADIVGLEVAATVRDWTLKLYTRAAAHAAKAGILLADTKFEFGLTDDGLIWIDEALTPDSSRFWDAATYRPGHSQDSFDKQFVRDYLEKIGWNKLPPGPALPIEIVEKTRAKYISAYEQLTKLEYLP